jgi:hypothetical protein
MLRCAAILCIAVQCAGTSPVLPIELADGTWPKTQGDLHLGDIRAKVNIPALDSSQPVKVPIWWRRRDQNPHLKGVFITDSNGAAVQPAAPPTFAADGSCGVVTFSPKQIPAVYYVYYLPYHQAGGGAWLHFHWANCTSHGPECVHALFSTQEDKVCDGLGTSINVVLQSRPTPAGSDKIDFFKLSTMELVATTDELTSLNSKSPPSALRAFMEPKENAVRMFDRVPASWAIGGERHNLTIHAKLGEYTAWQIGIYAAGMDNLTSFSLTFTDLVRASPIGSGAASPIPSSSLSCLNLGGRDYHGYPFNRSDFMIGAGRVGSLWVGVDLPSDASFAPALPAPTTDSYSYSGTAELHATAGTKVVKVQLAVNIEVHRASTSAAEPAAVPDHGAADIYSLSRLRWLDSDLGIDDTVPLPFKPVKLLSPPAASAKNVAGASAVTVELVNKKLTIGANGLLSQFTVDAAGPDGLLHAPMGLTILGASSRPLPLTVSSPASLVHKNNTGVYWTATLAGQDEAGARFSIFVDGNVEFDSFAEFSFRIVPTDSSSTLRLGDVQLSASLTKAAAPYMVGLGLMAVHAQDANWNWKLKEGNDMVWLGRQEAGFFLKLRGPGSKWEDPMFSSDYGVIPFIPKSWGGVNGTSGDPSCGANVSVSTEAVTVTAFSGPRELQASSSEEMSLFQFDVAMTPSKPLNISDHFGQRYIQVGYGGKGYTTPAQAKAENVTVVNLVSELIRSIRLLTGAFHSLHLDPNHPSTRGSVVSSTAP